MFFNSCYQYPEGKNALTCQKVWRVNVYLQKLSFTVYPMGQADMLQNFI